MSSLSLDRLRCPHCRQSFAVCACPEHRVPPIEPHPIRLRETGDRALYLSALRELGRVVVAQALEAPAC